MSTSTGRAPRSLFLLLSLLLIGGLAAAPADAAAQDEGMRGVQFDATGLWTTLVGGAFPFDESGWGGSAGLHYRWPSGLSLGLAGMHAQPEDLDLPDDDLRRHMTQWGAFVEMRYYLTGLTTFRPYLGGRAGWTYLDDERDEPAGTAKNGALYGLTVGTEIWASDRFAFRLSGTGGGISVPDYFQQDETTSGGTWTAEAGFSIFMGSVSRVTDIDGDGVADHADDCAGTPEGVEVDRRGCAIDADRDGIGDYMDECPGTLAGARVDDSGCALDRDGDGIPDGLDECANTPEGAEVDDRGCSLDADGDGVPDEADECPNTPDGTPVTETGCPRDSDGDGVHDGVDRCPNTPEDVEVDEEGCSRVEAGIERGRLRLSNIHFAFASAELTEDSRQILDQVGQALVDRPGVRVQVQGHTDSIGSEAANRRVSAARARAVVQYLRQNFPNLGADQLEAVGLGEGQPVATNGTDAGRAQNRRVEFVVLDEEGDGS